MRNSNEKNALSGGIAAVSLALILAACSTNQVPGNGQPTSPGTYGGTPPASTPGSSGGTSTTPPAHAMIVAPQRITPMFSSSADAIAVLRGHQGRVLGPSSPGPSGTGGVAIANDTMPLVPQSTVNSSISSPANSVVTGGDGGGVVFSGTSGSAAVSTAASTSAATAALTSAATNAPTTPAAVTVTAPLTTASPSNVALPATAGVFAAGPGVNSRVVNGTASSTVLGNQNTGLLTPAVSSAATPSPLAAANPPVASTNTSTSTTASTRNVVRSPLTVVRKASVGAAIARQRTFPATVSSSTSAATSATSVTGRARAVRVTTTSSGGVTISNQ